MPKLTRKQQKVFATSAANNGVFGSLQANDPTYSQDPDIIQSRTAYANGWNDATYSAEKLPPLEEFQSLQYLFSRQIAYIMQEGIPEWNTNDTYYKGALVKAIQGDGSFILYASLVDNNQGNLVTDTTKWVITNTSTNFHQGIPNWRADVIYSSGDWVKAQNGGNWSIFESTQNNNLNNPITDTDYWEIKPFTSSLVLLTPQWFDYEINDVSWLRADTFSWQDGTVYSNVYDHLVEDYNGGTSQTETVGSYTITYVLADDGHKITTDETNVANIYNESGVAWYYILDTANQRFKLPRTKYGFVGLRDTVGKYVPETLPQHTHTVGNIPKGQNNGGKDTFAGGNDDTTWKTETSSGANNSTYQDNAPVQQRSTQMYLYFYVGNFSQTATEQTAGLNSELFNGKLDLDAGNATSGTKETIVGWGMPDYSSAVSKTINTDYIAETNGWLFFARQTTTTGTSTIGTITIDGQPLKFQYFNANTGTQLSSIFVPIKKGSSYRYENQGNTYNELLFFPCLGG